MFNFNQRPFPLSFLILAIFILLASAGYSFSLYFFYPELETLLQGLSGLWGSLVILGLAMYFGEFNTLKDYKIKSFLVAFVSATLIGVVWEIVRNLYQLTDVLSPDYNLVTAVHILANAVGGALAHFYFVKRKKTKEGSPGILYPAKS